MKHKTEIILWVLNVVAWVVFIGLLVETGAIIFSWAVSLIKTLAASDLYEGLDLSAYKNASSVHYHVLVWIKVVFYGGQAFVAYLMTKLMAKLNIERPFDTEVAQLMHRISMGIFQVWLIALFHNMQVEYVEKKYDIAGNPISLDFILLAGIVYVFAEMFKRGVEMQAENELTI